MRKILVILWVVFAFSATTFAQTTFGKGTSVISAGIGIGSSYYGAGYSTKIPPVFASYEYGIVDNLFANGKGVIGVGGQLGFTSAGWKISDTSHNVNYMTLAARGSLHYQFVDNLDTYAGLSLGYYFINDSIDDLAGGSGGDIAWGLNLGARYYFNPNFSVMAELGYGISVLSLGVSYRF